MENYLFGNEYKWHQGKSGSSQKTERFGIREIECCCLDCGIAQGKTSIER